jgi:hypothetical protein
MQKQSDACRKQALKFAASIQKNPSMHFHLKEKVLEAAVTSSMTYGCEGWPSQDLKSISMHHMSCVKLLLGVRRTTPNALCLLEIGHTDIATTVLKRQGAFLRKFLATSSGDEPLRQALHICGDNGLAGRLQRAAADPANPATAATQAMTTLCHQQAAAGATRYVTYIAINPDLTRHELYSKTPNVLLPEHQRIAASRMRLSSHRLRIETGRWTRIPRERRVCPCDDTSIQDERHVLTECALTRPMRQSFPATDSPQMPNLTPRQMCELCFQILNFFQ